MRTFKGAFPRVSAQFFSDSHAFHPYNGGIYKHVKKLYAGDSEKIYFVGDISDFEYVEHALYEKGFSLEEFPVDFMKVMELVKPHYLETHLRFYDAMYYRADKGDEIIFLGGNHDEGMDLLSGEMLEGVRIQKEATYDAGEHGRFHVEHGQHFDIWFGNDYSCWLSSKACRILDRALELDFELGQKYKSLKGRYTFTNALKGFAKGVGVVKPFKANALKKAAEKGATGVICGHIHKPANRFERHEGQLIRYINTGDGLTHGTNWLHGFDGRWTRLKSKHLPDSAMAVLEDVNPLEKYREQSLRFLQTGWRAQLAYLNEKVAKRENETELGSVTA